MSVRNLVSGGGGNTFDSGSDTSSALGLTLDATASGSPGNVSVAGQVSGEISIGSEEVLNRRDENIDITVSMGSGQFEDAINNALQEYIGQFSIGASALPGGVSASILDTNRDIPVGQIREQFGRTVEREIRSGIRFLGLFEGPSSVDYEFTAEYQPIPVPSTENFSISDLTSEVGDIPVTVTVTPKEFIQRTLTSDFTGAQRPEVTLEIPASVLFEPVEIELGDCAEQFSGLFTDARSFRQDAQSTLSGLEDGIDTLEDVRSNVVSSFGVGQLQDINPQEFSIEDVDVSRDRLTELRSRVSSVRAPGEGEIEAFDSIQSRATNLGDRIDSIDRGECRQQLRDIFSGGEENLQRIGELSSTVSELKQRLSDILDTFDVSPCGDRFSDIERGISNLEGRVRDADLRNINVSSMRSDLQDIRTALEDEISSDSGCFDQFQSRLDNIQADLDDIGPGLGCGDVSRSLRNRVGGFESEADEFVNRDRRRLSASRYQNLIDESEDIESQIESEVSDENPCEQRLLSRVEDSRGRLRQFWEGISDELPCSSEYQSLSSSVQDFRQNAATIEPFSNPQRAASMASEGQRLVERVRNNVDRESCRSEFINQIRTSIQNLEVQEDRVRIIEEGELGDTERREQFEQLRDNVSSTLEDLDSVNL